MVLKRNEVNDRIKKAISRNRNLIATKLKEKKNALHYIKVDDSTESRILANK